MKVVALESPFAGDVARNVAYAEACVRECALRYGEAAFAMHLYFPHALQDLDDAERSVGIEAGLALVGALQAEASVVYVDLGVSSGMRQGIKDAWAKGRAVVLARLGAGRLPIEKGAWAMVDFFAESASGWTPPERPAAPAEAPTPAKPAPAGAEPDPEAPFDVESLQEGDVVMILHTGTQDQRDYRYEEKGPDADPEAFKKSLRELGNGWTIQLVMRGQTTLWRMPAPPEVFHEDPPPYVAPTKDAS